MRNAKTKKLKTNKIIKKEEKRKRGRPPKNKEAQKVVPVIAKKKRGRPPRLNKETKTNTPPKKRGRPPKNASNQESKTKKEHEIKQSVKYENEFEAKLFINQKPSSKQIDEYSNWLIKYNEAVTQINFENQIKQINSLQNILNKVVDSSTASIVIPPIFVTKGDKITFVLFEPFDRGAEVIIKYKTGLVPPHLSSSAKYTAVCNKITESIQKFVPVGVCC
jgi:hypothetical protein